MNRPRSSLIAAACAAVLALAGASSMAQPAPAAASATPAAEQAVRAPAGEPQARRHGMTPEQRQQAFARRAEAFKQKLALTPAQEPAWNTLQQALQPGQRHARLDAQGADWQQLTTPERIDRLRALQAQRAAEMDRRGEAIKAFYATLSPAQQKTFDEEGTRMIARLGHGRHGHPGMHSARHGGPSAEGAHGLGGHSGHRHGLRAPLPQGDAAPGQAPQPQ